MENIIIMSTFRGKKDDSEGKVATVDYIRGKEADPLYTKKYVPKETPSYAQCFVSITTALKKYEDKSGVAINIYAPRNGVAAKGWEISRKVSIANRTGTPVDMDSLYQEFMGKFEQDAIKDYVDTLQKLLANKNIVRMNDIQLINYVELDIPEGITINEGEELMFENSVARVVTEDGLEFDIHARWKDFSRNKAKVAVFYKDTDYPVHAVKLSNNPKNLTAELLLARDELWKEVPEVVRNVVAEARKAKVA